ncbi:MAG: type IV toxin-antitoxin system AbiEi family antitoxin domain-containing protein [Thermoanaerobaculales bacterium]|jgi:predicted transcriptional regulator of viral defense system|nr:type IV toxin-antitoxin system AbiEi family antitoxin domain-containing protein [Thermoanaerobaculales bacterium]
MCKPGTRLRVTPTEQRVLDLVREIGIARVRDLTARGLHPEHLRRLVKKGRLERLNHGVYALADREISEHHSLVQVAVRAPRSIVCLLSALQYHEFTTQMPREVWIAIEQRERTPAIQSPSIQVVRFSGRAFSEGWTEHKIEQVPVRVFDPAKTVADCFKFRNTVGMEVAMEALRDCLRDRRATVDELLYFARVCRVERVMRPYLEAFQSL